MEISKKLKDDASDFVTFMYQKGYRGRFMLNRKVPTRMIMRDELSHCLDEFMKKYITSGKKTSSLQLETFPPYNDDLLCQFKVDYDEVKGFLVKEITIYNERNNDKKHFRLNHNHQVPGSQSVIGLFPNPKPWEQIVKGRWKPKL